MGTRFVVMLRRRSTGAYAAFASEARDGNDALWRALKFLASEGDWALEEARPTARRTEPDCARFNVSRRPPHVRVPA